MKPHDWSYASYGPKERDASVRRSFRSFTSPSRGIWCVNLTPLELEAAFRIEDGSRIGFWDALIVAAAMRAGATTLLSEDLTAGRVISGVRIRNPFATSKS